MEVLGELPLGASGRSSSAVLATTFPLNHDLFRSLALLSYALSRSIRFLKEQRLSFHTFQQQSQLLLHTLFFFLFIRSTLSSILHSSKNHGCQGS